MGGFTLGPDGMPIAKPKAQGQAAANAVKQENDTKKAEDKKTAEAKKAEGDKKEKDSDKKQGEGEKRQTKTLDDVVTRWRFVMTPDFPPLPLEDCTFVVRGLLLPLRGPLLRSKRGLYLFKLLDAPELRPERIAARQDCRKFKHLPLVSLEP